MACFISAGHHLKDSGAVGNGYKENELTIEFRNLVVSACLKRGLKVITDKDTFELPNFLKGNGELRVNMNNSMSNFTLGNNVGSEFTGQFIMQKGTLTGDNLSVMNNKDMTLTLQKVLLLEKIAKNYKNAPTNNSH